MLDPPLVEKFQGTDLQHFFEKVLHHYIFLKKSFFRTALLLAKLSKVLHHYHFSISFLEQLLFFCKNFVQQDIKAASLERTLTH